MTLPLLIDADACPYREEIITAAIRHGFALRFFAAQAIKALEGRQHMEMILCDDSLDAADREILKECQPGQLVLTGDIPLAKAALDAGALVLGWKGPFTQANISEALARRELYREVREHGRLDVTGGKSSRAKKQTKANLCDFKNHLERLLCKLDSL